MEKLNAALGRIAYSAPTALAQRLTHFNILQSAFVDPVSGRVFLTGYYDPAYATGAIPYDDLLADTLNNPYPAFSLENPGLGDPVLQQIRTVFDKEFARISSDSNYGIEWLKGLVLPVLTGSSDSEERAALGAKLQAIGSSLVEYDAFLKWQATQFNDSKYFPAALGFFRRLCDHAGYGEGAGASLASYLLFAAEKDSDALANWAEASGCSDTMARINREVGQGRDRRQAGAELTATLYSAMLGRLGGSPAQLRQISAGYRQGTLSEKAFVDLVDPLWGNIYKKYTTNTLINGMTFSGAGLSGRYGIRPIFSALNTFGAPRDTALMDVFFRADYTLKYVTASARAASQVPGHTTAQAFLGTAENQAGSSAGRTPTTGLIRYWIHPSSVGFDEFPNHSGIRFHTALLRIGAEPLETQGGDARGKAFFLRSLSDYGKQLTKSYEAYAKAYPSLHVIRETAKVIALVRWARSNGVRLQVAPSSAHYTLPARAEGFWGMTYLTRPSGETDTMVVWAQGGVKFDQEAGEAWLQGRAATAEVTNDTLKQLAASTGLAARAAAAAEGGDLESARSLAESSAQAMTGRIDLSKLPEPVMVMVGGAPDLAGQAQVAQAGIVSVERNTAGLKQARQTNSDATGLQTTNPQEAANLQRQAQQLQTRSEQNLQRLQDLLRQYGAGELPSDSAVVHLSQLDPNKPLAVASFSAANAPRNTPVPETPKVKTREEVLAELASLHREIEATKTQLMKLGQSVQSDLRQYAAAEKASREGILSCREIITGLLIDASLGSLLERYREMERLSQTLPGKPEAYVQKIRKARLILDGVSKAKTFTDLVVLADKERKTLPEMLDVVRDSVGIIAGELGLDEKTVTGGVLGYKFGTGAFLAGSAWKYGTATVDMLYNVVQCQLTWDSVEQLDRNNDASRRALESLSKRLSDLMEQTKKAEALLLPPQGQSL